MDLCGLFDTKHSVLMGDLLPHSLSITKLFLKCIQMGNLAVCFEKALF